MLRNSSFLDGKVLYTAQLGVKGIANMHAIVCTPCLDLLVFYTNSLLKGKRVKNLNF